MPPKKRKAAAAREVHIDADALEAINDKLKTIDAAVEERCEAIMAAAEAAVAKLMHELKYRLMGMPKKVKAMKYQEYIQTVEQAEPAPEAAAAAAVDNKLAQLQERSVAAATAAPTTRSLRSRSRAATGGAAAAAAEPRTVRVTRARQPVPKFDSSSTVEPAAPQQVEDAPAAEQQAAPEVQAAAAAAAPAAVPSADAPDSSTPPAEGCGRPRSRTAAVLPPLPEAAPSDAAGQQDDTAAAAEQAKRAGALSRAQAKVDAKLASLGLAASTAARGAGRTAMRAAQPDEACFSKNGSPLSIHPNITRSRGRTAGNWALMTPAVAAAAGEAAGPHGAMLGCFTLVKKGGAAGGAAATSRAGRSRAATAAAAAASKTEAGADTAIVIQTDDGKTFTVDAAAGGLEAVPASHRGEVEAKLRAIQQLAANALKGM